MMNAPRLSPRAWWTRFRTRIAASERFRFRDTARVAVGHIRESYIFFIANVVAIGVGVMLVVVMLSMSQGLSRYVNTVLSSEASAEMIEVTADPRTGVAAPLTARTIDALRALPKVQRVTPVIDSIFAELQDAPGHDTFISLSSTTGVGDAEVARSAFVAGSLAAMRAENTIVIPANVAGAVGIAPADKAVGRKVIVRVSRSGPRGEEWLALPVTIVAVARQTRFSRCYIPLSYMRRIWRWQNVPELTERAAMTGLQSDPAFVYGTALVYAASVDHVPVVRSAIEKRGYRTASILDSVRRYQQIMLIATVVLTSLGLIALFTGSVSIFSAAYAAVLRRTREFAIYKSYGATRAAILCVVLSEAAITALAAGILGFAAGGGVCFALQRLVGAEVDATLFPIEWWLLGAALAVSCIASLSASIIPALRASNLSPTEAMRVG